MGKGQPYLPNLEPLIAAGINPKTGLPVKISSACKEMTKEEIKKFLRIIDEQDAVNRYTWYGLPTNITGQELERMLYYKGQLCFFYNKETNEFYFMPYTLDGTIDFYGRYNTIHPVPMTSGKEDKSFKNLETLLSQIKLKCVYGMKQPEDVTLDVFENSAVLLHDYTKQLSQNIIPRQQLNDALLDVEAECIPFMRTALIAATGVKGMRVNDADESQNVIDAANSIEHAALTGKPWIPILAKMDLQDLTNGQTAKAEEYMMAMQSLDNLRLSGYGLDNGGLYEKKAHMLNAEAAVNQNNVGLVNQDGLSIRQNFCNIVNSIWGLTVWCEPSQNETMLDVDSDGKVYDSNEGESSAKDTSTSAEEINGGNE